MLIRTTPIIASVVAFALFAGGVSASDEGLDIIETTAHAVANPDDVNRALARRAHAAAVEEAVEGVLAANASNLDIRIAGRTSGNATANSVASR